MSELTECDRCKGLGALLEQDRERQKERWADHHREHELLAEMREQARKAVDQRLEEMNNLRRQIEAERGVYLRGDVFDKAHLTLTAKVDAVYRYIYLTIGALAIISILVQVLGAMFVRHLWN